MRITDVRIGDTPRVHDNVDGTKMYEFRVFYKADGKPKDARGPRSESLKEAYRLAEKKAEAIKNSDDSLKVIDLFQMYVENNPRQMYWHGLSAPEWFKWFTSANHNRNSSKIDESPYYLRNYDGCKQNVMDLCNNAELNEEEMQKVMEMFEKNWKLLGTERMCVSLIPKSVIGKANIEDAIIPGQSAIETIKTVLTDGRKQYKEHEGNVLKTTVTEKNMLIMGLPNASEIFGEHEFSRETKEKLYDPKQVLDLIYRGTKESGFELSQDKINSIIETLREGKELNPINVYMPGYDLDISLRGNKVLPFLESKEYCKLNILKDNVNIGKINIKRIPLTNGFASGFIISDGVKQIFYCPCHAISIPIIEELKNMDCMIMNLGNLYKNDTNLTNFKRDNLRIIDELKPKKTIFTHIE